MDMKPATMSTTTPTSTSKKNPTMESLGLPKELYWDGKTEPTSPQSNDLLSLTESSGHWSHEHIFANGITLIGDGVFELKSEFEVVELLENCDDIVIDLKEEWPLNAAISNPNLITKVCNSYEVPILDANNYETAILTPLTPPQSPPQRNVSPPAPLQTIIPTFHGVHQQSSPSAAVSVPHTIHLPAAITPPPPAAAAVATENTPVHDFHFTNCFGNNSAGIPTHTTGQLSDDVERDIQIVDDFLKSCVQSLNGLNDDCESQSSYSAPSQTGSTTDEEWMPDSCYSSGSSSPLYVSSEDVQMHQSTSASICSSDDFSATTSSAAAAAAAIHNTITTNSGPKKRTRPYGRGIEDRKIRKKEQNKNAATRYRQKKKQEMEIVLSEEQELMQHNEKLRSTLSERRREIKYLKTLIREFYQKKA